MTVRTLTLSDRRAAIIHTAASAESLSMTAMAVRFASEPLAAKLFREEASVWRGIGKEIEVLYPDLEPTDWS